MRKRARARSRKGGKIEVKESKDKSEIKEGMGKREVKEGGQERGQGG